MHGRTPQEVPPQQLGAIKNYEVLTSLTGPHGGLVSVNQTEKHLSASDPEINFIDNPDDECGMRFTSSGAIANVYNVLELSYCVR